MNIIKIETYKDVNNIDVFYKNVDEFINDDNIEMLIITVKNIFGEKYNIEFKKLNEGRIYINLVNENEFGIYDLLNEVVEKYYKIEKILNYILEMAYIKNVENIKYEFLGKEKFKILK